MPRSKERRERTVAVKQEDLCGKRISNRVTWVHIGIRQGTDIVVVQETLETGLVASQIEGRRCRCGVGLCHGCGVKSAGESRKGNARGYGREEKRREERERRKVINLYNPKRLAGDWPIAWVKLNGGWWVS